MKRTFKLSAIVATLVSAKHDIARIEQACEAELNRGKLVETVESGLRVNKKEQAGKSSLTAEFTHAANAVTAFIDYGQAECGAVDKMNAKAAKLGFSSGKLESIPATFKGQDIAAWVAKFANGGKAPKGGKGGKGGKAPSGKGIPAKDAAPVNAVPPVSA
jgi:hypothetical protein